MSAEHRGGTQLMAVFGDCPRMPRLELTLYHTDDLLSLISPTIWKPLST